MTAELVDVGAGIAEADYAGKTVTGRIVLAYGAVAAAHREAVWKRGALGVLSHATNRPDVIDAPDQVAWGRLPFDAKDVDGVKDGTPVDLRGDDLAAPRARAGEAAGRGQGTASR